MLPIKERNKNIYSKIQDYLSKYLDIYEKEF